MSEPHQILTVPSGARFSIDCDTYGINGVGPTKIEITCLDNPDLLIDGKKVAEAVTSRLRRRQEPRKQDQQ